MIRFNKSKIKEKQAKTVHKKKQNRKTNEPKKDSKKMS